MTEADKKAPSGDNELETVVIGTVVRLGMPQDEGGEGGTTGERLSAVLADEGRDLSTADAEALLSRLYDEGRIDRDDQGRYIGV